MVIHYHLVFVLAILHLAISYPQNLRDIQNFSPSEEVNALPEHIQHSRSINHQIGVQNFEDTVKEVESLIKSNPNLPRLTRGEILDILENIKKEDQKSSVSQNQDVNEVKTNENKEVRDPKALMVVKAFTPQGSGEVEELFTKKPITKIIENENSQEETSSEVVYTTQRNSNYRRRPTKGNSELKNKIVGSEKKTPFRGTTQFKLATTDPTTSKITTETAKSNVKRRRRPLITTNINTKDSNTGDSNTRDTNTKRPGVVTTYHPRRRFTTTREPEKHLNHRYPEAEEGAASTFSGQGIKIISPPNLEPALEPAQINFELLDDLEPQEGSHKTSVIPSSLKFEPQEGIVASKLQSKRKFKSTTESYSDKIKATPSIEVEVPDHLKTVVANLNLAPIKNPESITITSIEPGTDNPTEEEKIKNILASIGVIPADSTMGNSVKSTTEAVPNAEVVAENLSPDMRDLLKSFGLLSDSKEEISNTNQNENQVFDYLPEKASTNPESYVGFKPLPEDPSGRKEMEEFLSQFGLVDVGDRKAKSLKGHDNKENTDENEEQADNINMDVVPEEFKSVIADMGFQSNKKQSRKIRDKPHPSENLISSSEKPERTTTIKQHVFNPNEQYASEEGIRKLGRLLEIMKKLERFNGTITKEELKKIDTEELRDIVTTLNQSLVKSAALNHEGAPDPLNFDNGLEKNEIKRQEGITQVVTVKAEDSTTTSPEDKTPSLKDLEDSFGGPDSSGSGSSTQEAQTEPAPTTPRTGFYYLLDWNSFFEIDDQKGKRVNLRFQPKAGDPKRFYSISVP